MKNLIYLFFPILLLIISCSNPIENADKIIAKQVDSTLNSDLKELTSNMEFLYYANPTNYWYPEEYTINDIFNDKFQQGYRGLTKLKEDINAISSNDAEIVDEITNLKEQINIALKDIRSKQNSIELSISMGIYNDFTSYRNLYVTNDKKEKARQMPENVQDSFNKLVELLLNKYNGTASKIKGIEKYTFETIELNEEEKLKIINNLKLLIRNKINNQFNSQDTTIRDEMIKKLFKYYDENENNTSYNNSTSSNGKGIVKGLLNYPSEYIPSMKVYLKNIETNEVFTIDTKDGQAEFEIKDIPEGVYIAYAYATYNGEIQNMPGGGHTTYEPIADAEVTDPKQRDHTLLKFNVKNGEVTEGISIYDWYGPVVPKAN